MKRWGPFDFDVIYVSFLRVGCPVDCFFDVVVWVGRAFWEGSSVGECMEYDRMAALKLLDPTREVI